MRYPVEIWFQKFTPMDWQGNSLPVRCGFTMRDYVNCFYYDQYDDFTKMWTKIEDAGGIFAFLHTFKEDAIAQMIATVEDYKCGITVNGEYLSWMHIQEQMRNVDREDDLEIEPHDLSELEDVSESK